MPEILPYGNSTDESDEAFRGILYRYDGAEHIGIEQAAGVVVVYASTSRTTDEIIDHYQEVFGIPAEVEPFDDDPFGDSDRRVDEEETESSD